MSESSCTELTSHQSSFNLQVVSRVFTADREQRKVILYVNNGKSFHYGFNTFHDLLRQLFATYASYGYKVRECALRLETESGIVMTSENYHKVCDMPYNTCTLFLHRSRVRTSGYFG